MRRAKLVVFPSLACLLGCSAGVQDWADAYKYQASVDWSAEKEKEKLLPKPQEEAKQAEQSLYQKEQSQKMLSLLRETPTPLRVPPTIVRVLILPYVDEKGNLNAQRYVFFKADEGKWILGDYLLQKGKPIRELKPLEEVK